MGENSPMPLEIRLIIIAALVLLVVGAGFYWRITTGRAKRVADGTQIDLARLGATKNGKPVTEFGKKITFLQFSTEMCSQCRQTAHLLGEFESQNPDVLHIEFDLTHRLDVAKKFNILQTPTTLVLDSHGRVTSRIGGAAKTQTIQDEIGHFQI
jgi:thiol-disulfide isomerase/thioredoxin